MFYLFSERTVVISSSSAVGSAASADLWFYTRLYQVVLGEADTVESRGEAIRTDGPATATFCATPLGGLPLGSEWPRAVALEIHGAIGDLDSLSSRTHLLGDVGGVDHDGSSQTRAASSRSAARLQRQTRQPVECGFGFQGSILATELGKRRCAFELVSCCRTP